MDSKEELYNFEFFFYNNHAVDYKRYFENRSRLSIWNEDFPDFYMPSMFIEGKEIEGKILGKMLVILPSKKNLHDNKNSKYYMNLPHNLVGHLILKKEPPLALVCDE